YEYLDDGYNPTTTSSVTRKLVLQDKVFAVFNALGTPTHLAVVDYLNSEKVPDLFVASGCNCWNDPSTHPYTFGWQPDYTIEGKILGQYIQQNLAGKKVGYFYQNDEFGLDGVKGLDQQISSVASRQNYVPTNTNVAPQIAALQASGAQVVVSFSIPAFTALALLSAANVVDEMAASYAFVQAIKAAGRNPTRAGIVHTLETTKLTGGPGLAPYGYGSNNHLGYLGVQVATIGADGNATTVGPVYTSSD